MKRIKSGNVYTVSLDENAIKETAKYFQITEQSAIQIVNSLGSMTLKNYKKRSKKRLRKSHYTNFARISIVEDIKLKVYDHYVTATISQNDSRSGHGSDDDGPGIIAIPKAFSNRSRSKLRLKSIDTNNIIKFNKKIRE